MEETGRIALEHALAEHGVETRLVGMVVGPTVTRYEPELGPGVKVARVAAQRTSRTPWPPPTCASWPQSPADRPSAWRCPTAGASWSPWATSWPRRSPAGPTTLEVAVGRDIMGCSVLANLATMPHLLIAGATGAGKSSCINTLITSVLMRTTPDQVRLILVDPGAVELGQYNRLPHLLTQVDEPGKGGQRPQLDRARDGAALRPALRGRGPGHRGLQRRLRPGQPSPASAPRCCAALGHLPEGEVDLRFPRLPYILVVVDELNDLMMVAARDVEDSICRIAQMARAVGIHLVIATQRPSVNVITG